jgi:hypothetical protein
MIINQIASMVFDDFADTGIVIAIIGRTGSYVSNKLDVFERIFVEGGLLDGLCGRVDDGQEPVISRLDGHLVAASGLSAGFDSIGYVVMLLPAGTSEQSVYFDFIEIIFAQFSHIAGLIVQNQRLRDYSEAVDLDAFAAVN